MTTSQVFIFHKFLEILKPESRAKWLGKGATAPTLRSGEAWNWAIYYRCSNRVGEYVCSRDYHNACFLVHTVYTSSLNQPNSTPASNPLPGRSKLNGLTVGWGRLMSKTGASEGRVAAGALKVHLDKDRLFARAIGKPWYELLGTFCCWKRCRVE